MLVSRHLIMKYQSSPYNYEESSIPFPRLFRQGKLISQIISYIWLWADSGDPYAIELADYFKHPTEEGQEIGGKLKKLFAATPNAEGSQEEKALHAVFPNTYHGEFPIFSQEELDFYCFNIDVNNFQGTIDDANLNSPQLMTLFTPFPPCPKFSNATVMPRELEDWINNRNPMEVISNNPYIPTCTS